MKISNSYTKHKSVKLTTKERGYINAKVINQTETDEQIIVSYKTNIGTGIATFNKAHGGIEAYKKFMKLLQKYDVLY